MALLVCLMVSGAGADELSPSLTDFGTALYSRLSEHEGNVFVSPYSIATALAMAGGGARGRTADEICKVLKLNEPHRTLQEIAGELSSRDENMELIQANGLWVDRTVPLNQDYRQLLQERYRAALESVDFAAAPAEATAAINRYVAGTTRQKIPQLVSTGDIASDTTVVLANAIYFKAPWETPFDPLSTRPGSFLVGGTNPVVMPMMRRKGEFNTLEEDDFLLVDLPYEGGQLSMVVLVPESPTGLPAVERRLGELSDWLAVLDAQQPALEVEESVLIMPRFSMRSRFDLKAPLISMGLASAFGDGDFSGISEVPMQLGKVLHEAALEVTEAGSEASAATAVVLSRSAPVPVINVNRPFLLAIRDKPTGTLLFLGRVVDPR